MATERNGVKAGKRRPKPKKRLRDLAAKDTKMVRGGVLVQHVAWKPIQDMKT